MKPFENFLLTTLTIIIIIVATVLPRTTAEVNENTVVVNTSHFYVRKIISDQFLGFTIDSKQLANHWKTIDLTNFNLIFLAKQLMPAYLRIGGTMQDNIRFCPNSSLEACKGSKGNAAITESDLGVLSEFASGVGVDLIYGLNVLQRRKSGDWDPHNSVEVIKWFDNTIVKVKGWELGNEPNRFPKVFGQSVDAKVLAHDFNRLHHKLASTKTDLSPFILGPDLTDINRPSESQFLIDFLKHVEVGCLSAITFHHYYLGGTTSTVLNFLDVDIMNTLKDQLKLVTGIAKRYRPGVPVWLGESASSFGGGSVNISDRYLSSFMFLDTLGLCAKFGIHAVLRQVLVSPKSTTYHLIDSFGRPTPNYYVSYIFKKLVGNYVLNVPLSIMGNNETTFHKGLRVYCHCSRHMNGGIVLFGMNVGTTSVIVKFSKSRDLIIKEYLLTPYEGDLQSKFCELNREVLKYKGDSVFPQIRPRLVRNEFVIPKLTLGFWVVTDAKVPGCNRE